MPATAPAYPPAGPPAWSPSELPVYEGGAAAYSPNAVRLDGTNDYLVRAAKLTGQADADSFFFACWLELEGDGTFREILEGNFSSIGIELLSNNTFRVRAWSRSSGLIICNMTTATAYTSADGWIHLAVWHNGTSGGIMVNGVDDTAASPVNDAGDIRFDISTQWAVGSDANSLGDRKYNGCMGDPWFNIGGGLTDADIGSFYNNGPVSLGADGSAPGVDPIIYLGNPAATFHENLGTGGDFTVTGELEYCLSPGAT